MQKKSFDEKVLSTLSARNEIANCAWLDIKLILNKTEFDSDKLEDAKKRLEIVGKLDTLRGMCKVISVEVAKLKTENEKLKKENEELRMRLSEMEEES